MSEEVNTTSPIEEAKTLLAQLEKVKSENQAILERMEATKAEHILSGKGIAGIPPAQKSNDEIIKDRCNEILKATGLKI